MRTARATVTLGYVRGPRNSTRFSSMFQIGAYAGIGISARVMSPSRRSIRAPRAAHRGRCRRNLARVSAPGAAGAASRRRRSRRGRSPSVKSATSSAAMPARDREPEQRGARAERDERGPPTVLFQGARATPTTDASAPLPPVASSAIARLACPFVRKRDRWERRHGLGPRIEGERNERAPQRRRGIRRRRGAR